MSDHYAIDPDGTVRRVDDLHEWARWFETSGEGRRIGFTDLGDVHVSTVFLAIDHRFLGDGPPILFETMIFGGEFDQWMDRYQTIEAARAGHARVVEALRAGASPDGAA